MTHQMTHLMNELRDALPRFHTPSRFRKFPRFSNSVLHDAKGALCKTATLAALASIGLIAYGFYLGRRKAEEREFKERALQTWDNDGYRRVAQGERQVEPPVPPLL